MQTCSLCKHFWPSGSVKVSDYEIRPGWSFLRGWCQHHKKDVAGNFSCDSFELNHDLPEKISSMLSGGERVQILRVAPKDIEGFAKAQRRKGIIDTGEAELFDEQTPD